MFVVFNEKNSHGSEYGLKQFEVLTMGLHARTIVAPQQLHPVDMAHRPFPLAGVLALSLAAVHTGTFAQSTARPPTVALLAAVGDQLDIVRQRESTGSLLEPFSRRHIMLNGQSLNLAALTGLDRAIEEDEPDKRRVLLTWSPPAELKQRLADAHGAARETLLLQSLQAYLEPLPARAEWDRIELILPAYQFASGNSMGRKLVGVGFYVQPLYQRGYSIDTDIEDMAATPVPENAANRVINPNTGEAVYSDTFVAAYMYFQRVTLDARTLEVTARKRQLDHVKYADPSATARDVADTIPMRTMLAKLLALAERSAYTSVRGKSTVNVTAPKAVEPGASAPGQALPDSR
jgi:hypothetical protein